MRILNLPHSIGRSWEILNIPSLTQSVGRENLSGCHLTPRGLRPLGARWHPSRFFPPSLLRLWIFTNLSLSRSGRIYGSSLARPQYYLNVCWLKACQSKVGNLWYELWLMTYILCLKILSLRQVFFYAASELKYVWPPTSTIIAPINRGFRPQFS